MRSTGASVMNSNRARQRTQTGEAQRHRVFRQEDGGAELQLLTHGVGVECEGSVSCIRSFCL